MQNAGLDETQAESKIAGENISNLRYADDPTLWQKVKKYYITCWWKRKRRVKKAGLNLNIQKVNIMASGPITS